MKLTATPTALALTALLAAGTARATEAPPDSTLIRYTAEELTVSGEKGDILRQVTGDESSILNPSQMSVYKVINMMPSLSQQSVDPYGLADIVNYHEAFRFRGVEATAGGVPSTTANVEGLPVTGRPGGGATIYDLENMENITIYSGVMPANRGLGLADVGGKIEMEIKRPQEEFAVDVKESVGSNDFRRTYLRLDTGEIGLGLKAFVSGSTSYADKWKGEGASNRNNLMLGVSETFSERVKLEAFLTYSKGLIHAYRALGYSDISDLDTAYSKDYSTDPTSVWYYDYNKNEFEDWMAMANLEVKTGEHSTLNIKPYYWSDKGYYLETATAPGGSNFIKRWDIDHDLKGILTEYATKIGDVDIDFGYLYHTQERPGPPTSWKKYSVVGGELNFTGWAILSNTSSHELHEPFIEARYRTGDWTLEGGLKYVNYTLPSIITYNTTGIGDISYEDALATDPGIVAAKSALDEKRFSRLFPNLTLTRTLSDNATVHLSYGENYVAHVDIYPYYISNYTAFSDKDKGITFEQLWDDREMEISHNLELGIELSGDDWKLAPTLYYAIHSNKQAVLYDSSIDAYYPMNDADAKGYGIELEGEYRPSSKLKCYGSFSWNRFYFDQEIASDATGNATIDVKGEQVPDAPEFMAKGIVSYRLGDLTISPVARYTSTRYGDALHEQKVDGATLFDLDLTWSRPMLGFKNVDCSLSFINIFDRKYVSMISTSDYKTLKTSYQPGAPFTLMATLAFHY
ncbi:outer membrane beta-barrel protein [Chlorobium sp. N1]|uniref:TonB-dependent receptor n=1 Tax=Chlorobium sp. N1 TaxID=2491138 RepID=UPI00103BC6FB|nr:outer membrane beta-barrel protein [Chlorobium sp. N1]TCD48691.1 TonB-dependent receptor [Chlorobium sp. N1]